MERDFCRSKTPWTWVEATATRVARVARVNIFGKAVGLGVGSRSLAGWLGGGAALAGGREGCVSARSSSRGLGGAEGARRCVEKD